MVSALIVIDKSLDHHSVNQTLPQHIDISHRLLVDPLLQNCSDSIIHSSKVWNAKMPPTACYDQGRINHSGAPYQRKEGALFSYAYPGFFLSGCTFLLPKRWRPFFSRQRMSTQRGKKLAVDWGRLAAGAPPMVQPAQWIILADAAVTPPSPKWPKMCRVGR